MEEMGEVKQPVNSDAEAGKSPPTYDAAQSDPPPTYEETMKDRLKKAKQESTGTKDFAMAVFKIVCGSAALLLGCFIVTGILMAIPIAMIVMGAMNKDDCPAEPYIPIYLIVAGACSLAVCVLSMCGCLRNRGDKDEGEGDGGCGIAGCCTGCFSGLISLFLTAWFIAGNVWIYRTHEPSYDSETENYCDKTLYLFSFWLMTTSYIFTGLACCIGILCGCIAACVGGKN
ncbi:transmembrane protein 272-like [Glandiceps talaboti]